MKAIYVIFCVQHLCIVWTGSSNEQGRHLRYSLTAHDGDKGSPSSGRQRYRRFTDYTESDIEYWINRHNQHRGEVDPPASDMKFMTWDDDLATMAQTWVDYCHWEHGDPDIQHSYEHTGQNMWVFGPSSLEERPTVSDAVDAWYDERYDYDYETNSCVPGRVCGHYTQVVWAESQALGCGIAFCPTVNNSQYVDSWMIVCNYGPSGNFIEVYPYQTGDACTKCSSGVGECYQNMCRLCSEHTEPCVCNAVCAKCGTVQDDCTCKCEDGWHGTDCSIPCENTHHYCGANPGWYDSSTCSAADYIPKLCPLMCGLCNATSGDTTCVTGLPTSPNPGSQHGDVTTSGHHTTSGTPTHEGVDVATSRSATSPSHTTQSRTTIMTPTQGQRSTLPTTVMTTIWMYTGSTECEVIIHCLNGGTFDAVYCECVCLDEYQGNACEHEKEQAEFGVLLMIYGDVHEWPSFDELLITAVSQVLNEFCNDNFELCCPDNGAKTSAEFYAFVNQTHIIVATGYPEIDADDESLYWVMLVVRPPIDNDLCESGTGGALEQPQQRRRRDNAAFLRRVVRSIGSGFYMDQEVLYEAIEEGLEVIQNITGIIIRELDRGRVIEKEPRDVNVVVKHLIGMELIVLFAILGLASLVIIVTVAVVALKRYKRSSGQLVQVRPVQVDQREEVSSAW